MAPGDYQAGTGTVTLTPGQSTAHIEVPTVDDAVDEDDQTFVVRLGTPVGATAGRDQATGTIADDVSSKRRAVVSQDVAGGGEGEGERPHTTVTRRRFTSEEKTKMRPTRSP